MLNTVFRIIIIGIICCMVVAGISLYAANRDYEECGTFDNDPNRDGKWCRGADSDGPLDADALCKVYIDHSTGEDVFESNSNFFSYANDPLFSGDYWLNASIWYRNIGSKEHGGVFNGPWYDYESNSYSTPKEGNEPKEINYTSAYSWAKGTQPPQSGGNGDSSPSGGQQGNNRNPVTYEVYAQVPF